MTNRYSVVSTLIALTTLAALPAQAKDKFEDRAQAAADALNDMATMPDHMIPDDLIARATCIAVIPNEKTGAFLFGGTYGRGLVSCRVADGWSLPSYMWVAGGSYGLQAGYKISDNILLFFGKEHAVEQAGAMQIQLGGEASVGFGPIGREAEGDLNVLTFSTSILSYSRARGVWAGVSFEGTMYRADRKANEKVYAKKVTSSDLLTSDGAAAPTGTGIQNFMASLKQLPARFVKAAKPANDCAPNQTETNGVCK